MAPDPPIVEPASIGGPTSSSWREQALTRVAELEDLTEVLRRESREPWSLLADRLTRHLRAARDAAQGAPARRPWARLAASVSGSPHERTASNLDAAEADLLQLAPAAYVRGQMPSLLAHARAHLAPGDPRLQRLEAVAVEAEHAELGPVSRTTVVAAVRAASSAARREVVRVRSFRSVLYVTATFLALAAVALGVLGFTRPDLVPLCFHPEGAGTVVCPTGDELVGAGEDADGVMRTRAASPWDVVLVELLGLIAAAVASATALRNIRGTATPYSLPVALALLKLPTGALTAVLGLMLMRGQFVPGLTALDTPAQIVAWAIIFGYAQQVFTQVVDRQAHTVLDQVGGQAASPRRATAEGPTAAYASDLTTSSA